MKKNKSYTQIILLSILLLFGTNAKAHWEMSISQVTGSPYCAGESFTISFTIHFDFDPGNIYTAQMSDASGSFANPVNIGTLAGIGAGTINCQIPFGTPAGSGYKFRIVSTSPAEIGDPTTSGYTINALPTSVISANGPTSFCGGTNVVLSANTGTGLQYTWYRNNVIQPGMNTSTATVTNSGKYKVVVTNAQGCTKISNKIITSVLPLPTATITPSGNNTICSGTSLTMNAASGTGYSYQWIKGSANINGATQSNYTTATGGFYRVLVTSPNGCSRKSDKTQVTVINCLREAEIASAFDFKVLQVPFSSSLELQLGAAMPDQFSIMVTDPLGRVVFKQDIKSTEGSETLSINSQNWAEGFYYVNVHSSSGSKTQQVVKIQ